jgi:hypothetical protein
MGKREGFLELTPTSASWLRMTYAGRESLRGGRFVGMRTKGGMLGRIVLRELRDYPQVDDLASSKDSEPVLRKLWQSNR